MKKRFPIFEAVLNTFTALMLVFLCTVNASYGYPSAIVAILGPVLVAAFLYWGYTWVRAYFSPQVPQETAAELPSLRLSARS